MRALTRLALLVAAVTAAACGHGPVRPTTLDAKHDTCGSCRMPVSDPRLAAQIAAPGEEAIFFDDIGCLRDYLAGGKATNRAAIAYVADHRTGAWVPGTIALYERCPSLETPMGSHLVAHADAASRAADPSSTGCAAVSAAEIFEGTKP